MRIRCAGLGVEYGKNGEQLSALQGVSFETSEGEFLSVIGPSGCGKTTLLHAIAGLREPTSGKIEQLPSPDDSGGRGLLVFQEASLFPWMTVLENAAFGLEMSGVARREREQRATELLDRYGLTGRERAYPHQLSAGMKQRVAVIRAFLSNPSLLLMDEPFAALDSQTRYILQSELLALWRQDRKSVLFVTHDVEEAIVLSDRILVMSSQPGTVIDEVTVPFPRGNRHASMLEPEFLSIKHKILSNLGMKVSMRGNAG